VRKTNTQYEFFCVLIRSTAAEVWGKTYNVGILISTRTMFGFGAGKKIMMQNATLQSA
jgi:hypothetical protein